MCNFIFAQSIVLFFSYGLESGVGSDVVVCLDRSPRFYLYRCFSILCVDWFGKRGEQLFNRFAKGGDDDDEVLWNLIEATG